MDLKVVQCKSPRCEYIGHGGDTWGSVSSNGWFKEVGVAWSFALTRNDVGTLDSVTTELIEIVVRKRFWRHFIVTKYRTFAQTGLGQT